MQPELPAMSSSQCVRAFFVGNHADTRNLGNLVPTKSRYGEVVIIRQSSKAGKEFVDRYSTIQETQGGTKCQYTYRETTGSDTYWVCPQPDINIISAKASKDLKKALAFQ
jgi:hypothetical protein